MQESIGGLQLFIIVITIIMLFAGIMGLTVNHANAFAVKDQIVQIIEKNDGFDFQEASSCLPNNCSYKPLAEIVEALQKDSYRTTGKCFQRDFSDASDVVIKQYQRDGRAGGSGNTSFCIARIPAKGNLGGYYYKVQVFYHLDIPILRSLINLKVNGETKRLYS